MKVFKFGGASVNSIERIKNVAEIVRAHRGEKLLIVVSAMGKTTNALEKVVESFYAGNKEEALALFQLIKQSHLSTLKYLVTIQWKNAEERLATFFTEVEWLLHDKPVKDYNYYYDQVVCAGELLSSSIISSFFEEEKIANSWIDVRDIFRTDDNFRDATLDWDFTQSQVNNTILPLFNTNNIVLSQGFIGSTDENESTTLGREGSDYSAAIFANMLDAESLTIWKDVEGVMNADPRQFKEAKFISALSYAEVIEMAYYGAQVIHPKTIKPLQNKDISFFVKCFLQPGLPGTIVSKKLVHNLPPIIVIKQNQVLLELSSKDFSFVGESLISRLYELFAEAKIRPNLIQNGAISIHCCLDDIPGKTDALALSASSLFEVQVQKNLTLLTIRHYTKEVVENLTAGKTILLEQRTTETLQAVMR